MDTWEELQRRALELPPPTVLSEISKRFSPTYTTTQSIRRVLRLTNLTATIFSRGRYSDAARYQEPDPPDPDVGARLQQVHAVRPLIENLVPAFGDNDPYFPRPAWTQNQEVILKSSSKIHNAYNGWLRRW
jgi:hypothetical protein